MSEGKVERLRAAASRLLAIIEHYEIRRKFRQDWTVLDRHADAFEDAHERVRETLAEVEKDG